MYQCFKRLVTYKEYSCFDHSNFLAHSMFTSDVCWDSLGTSIFENSSLVTSNTRSRLPSRLSFRFLCLCLDRYSLLETRLRWFYSPSLFMSKIQQIGKDISKISIFWLFWLFGKEFVWLQLIKQFASTTLNPQKEATLMKMFEFYEKLWSTVTVLDIFLK